MDLCRYVVLNPVRVGVVQNPEDWAWSSYRATVDRTAVRDWLLGQFSEDPKAACDSYVRFVHEGVRADSPWHCLRGQIYLGSDDFLERMANLVAAQDVQGVPHTHIEPARPTVERLLEVVCQTYPVQR